MKAKIFLSALIILSTGNLPAQDTLKNPHRVNPVYGNNFLSRFMLTGNGYINFEKAGDEKEATVHAAIFPILLWQISNKLFFEGSEEIAWEDQKLKTSVEFATLHYELNKYIALGAGKFLTPSGTYRERLHPNWINKFPEAPMGFSHEGGNAGSTAEIGLQVRGGSPVGRAKLNYVFYISNGPVVSVDSVETPMPGMLMNGELEDNNKNKALGGRIGFLPFANSSFEVGFAKQFARAGDRSDSIYSKAIASTHALDLSYVGNISSLKSILDIKGEFNYAMVDPSGKSSRVEMDSMSSHSVIVSSSKAYYLQFAVRPALSQKKILQKLELAARYSVFSMKDEGMEGIYNTQFAVGLNYWLSWRSVIKVAYMVVQEANHTEPVFVLQLAFAHPKINFKRKNKL